jgi:hypothetical protein
MHFKYILYLPYDVIFPTIFNHTTMIYSQYDQNQDKQSQYTYIETIFIFSLSMDN